MTAIEKLQRRLHRRKANRERKRRLHQGRRARREAKAVRTLRAQIRAIVDRRHRLPRVMFDDTSVELIPIGAKAVAGYVNGIYQTIVALMQRFPKARHVTIAVSSDANADFLDVENGDATNADAPGWFRRHRGNRGFYTSVSNADALVAELAAHGIRRHEYVLWTAHYGEGRHICGRSTCALTRSQPEATQWTSSSHERSLDESKLKAAFWKFIARKQRG